MWGARILSQLIQDFATWAIHMPQLIQLQHFHQVIQNIPVTEHMQETGEHNFLNIL
ncbi:Uncharacterised protein [Salmonella enterica subsp. enterica serovar Typhi]|nr:Uncharacterised protein [Salmonella enterica subsp. enterica serovar Typhi]